MRLLELMFKVYLISNVVAFICKFIGVKNMYITNAKAFPVQIIPPCKKELRQLQIFVKISIKHFMVIIIREQTPCSDYKP